MSHLSSSYFGHLLDINPKSVSSWIQQGLSTWKKPFFVKGETNSYSTLWIGFNDNLLWFHLRSGVVCVEGSQKTFITDFGGVILFGLFRVGGWRLLA